MCFEPRLHPLRVALRLHLVMLERVEDLGIVRRRDHPVEHPHDVLLHRVRLVDVLDQLLFQLAHRIQPPHAELSELASCDRGVAEVPAVLRLEPVHEQAEGRVVVKLETANLERHPGGVGELRRPVPAVDPLAASVERRQRTADPLHTPDPVELLSHPT